MAAQLLSPAGTGVETSRASAGLETGAGTNRALGPLTRETDTGAGDVWTAVTLRTGAQRGRGTVSEKTVSAKIDLSPLPP